MRKERGRQDDDRRSGADPDDGDPTVHEESKRREDEDLRLQQEREAQHARAHRPIGTDREDASRHRTEEEERPLAEDESVEARLGDEQRKAEDAVLDRAGREVGAEQRSQPECAHGNGEEHPDPARRFDRQDAEGQQRERNPGEVVVHQRTGIVDRELIDERAPAGRLVRIDPEDDGAGAAPQAREVIDVGELDAALERPEDHDEQDPDREAPEVGKVGTTIGPHGGTLAPG